MSHTDLSAVEPGPAADHSDEISRMRIALARTARRLSQQIPDVGLTPTQLSVLATVAREEDVPLGELADFEGLNPSMLSRVVGKLEPMGLIRRYADPADGRVAHVAITPDGAALQTQIKQARTAVFAAHVSALEPGLQQLLIDVVPALEALAEHLRAVAVPVRPIARPGGDGTAALESRTGDLPTD
jgi:DNA-binding MarR family transcriptional regulator